MSKVTLVILMAVVVAVSTQEVPFQPNALAAAAQSGNWDEFRKLIIQNVGVNNWPLPISEDIKSLRGGPEVHVYGESESSFQSSNSVGGHSVGGFSAAHRVINNDGKIVEYDFQP